VLRAADLHELVCTDLEDYRERALQLARQPERLQALRAQLDERRATLPVFDTQSYTRDLEALLMQAWQIGPRA
jgi:predicted O-linked N-acetylglucosamine transferase (SPINDLY family)